ncbi:MAG: DoxX family membrane protein [Deltaproteobacteria bacterium]|nr:DoxX family membrane protein [Deltaproteobacteria bacterium]
MPNTERLRVALRWVLTVAMVAIGVSHFTDPAPFVAIVPPLLPAPLALVYISGFFEVLGGLGLVPRATRRAAGLGLVALYVAVFPANIYMAVADVPMNGQHLPPALLWGRLPLQLVLIAWALWVSRPSPAPAVAPAPAP